MEKNDFKLNYLYNKLKDDIKINTMSQLRYYLKENKYIVDDRKLYVMITNYRIKKYGTSTLDVCVNKEDRHKYILNKYE